MAPLAMAAIPAVIGAVGSYKSAKDAKKQAAKGVNSQETSTRTPYGPATSHIQTILDAAKRQYEGGQQGPMPYAWQNFFNNPTGPGAGSDPTYGGRAQQSSGGGGGAAPALTWNGKDKSAVQAAKAERQQARYERQQAPQQQAQAQAPQQAGPGGGGGAPAGPRFTPQSGPFGYSQGIRDYMMQQQQQGGVQGYQPAMNYIQGLLGGQSQNPYLSQAFSRLQQQSYNPNSYFSAFQAPAKPGGPVDPGFLGGNGI